MSFSKDFVQRIILSLQIASFIAVGAIGYQLTIFVAKDWTPAIYAITFGCFSLMKIYGWPKASWFNHPLNAKLGLLGEQRPFPRCEARPEGDISATFAQCGMSRTLTEICTSEIRKYCSVLTHLDLTESLCKSIRDSLIAKILLSLFGLIAFLIWDYSVSAVAKDMAQLFVQNNSPTASHFLDELSKSFKLVMTIIPLLIQIGFDVLKIDYQSKLNGDVLRGVSV